jgi:hypothetical protein
MSCADRTVRSLYTIYVVKIQDAGPFCLNAAIKIELIVVVTFEIGRWTPSKTSGSDISDKHNILGPNF